VKRWTAQNAGTEGNSNAQVLYRLSLKKEEKGKQVHNRMKGYFFLRGE
jgi:hypothetical protein